MNENKVNDLIETSLAKIRELAGTETVVGNPIYTPNGTLILPVSKISMGFATGGVDLAGKRSNPDQNFGGGGGTGITVHPVGFLVIDSYGAVDFINVSQKGKPDPVDQIADLVERTPEIIAKVKDIFTKDKADDIV